MRFCFLIVFLCSFEFLFGQQSKDTCIQQFCGKLTTENKKGKQIKTFLSETTNPTQLKRYNLISEGNQDYSLVNLKLDYTQLEFAGFVTKDLGKMDFSALMEGKKIQSSAELKNQKITGNFFIKDWLVLSKRYLQVNQSLSMNFSENIPRGRLNYSNEKKEIISLNFDEEGFLNGLCKIKYLKDNQWINEERTYQNGVLKNIKLMDVNNKITKEFSLKLPEFTASEVHFVVAKTLLFNNDYDTTSNELLLQNTGNQFIQNVFSEMDIVLNLLNLDLSTSDFPLTRQFVIPLTMHELTDFENYVEQLQQFNSLLEKQLEQVFIAKSMNENLFSEAQNVQMRFQQNQIILGNLKKILIEKEIPYLPENGKKDCQIALNRQLKADSVIQKICSQINDLETFLTLWNDFIKGTIQQTNLVVEHVVSNFQTNERNTQIIQSMKLLEQLSNDISTSKLTKNYYERLTKRKLNPLKEQYFNGTLDEKNKEIGKELLCFLQLSTQQYKTLQKSALWLEKSDSIFTVFEEHPFDNRPFERKIVPHIKEKGNILVQELLQLVHQNAKCELTEQRFNALQETLAVLENLNKNYQNAETERINRLLKKEGNAVRIARILNIDFPI